MAMAAAKREEKHARLRKQNFSPEEVDILYEEYRLNRELLTASRSSKVTNKAKEKVWQAILVRVKAVGVADRTVEELKAKITNLKACVRAKVLRGIGTGGGPPAPPLPNEDMMMDLFGKNSCPLQIHGVPVSGTEMPVNNAPTQAQTILINGIDPVYTATFPHILFTACLQNGTQPNQASGESVVHTAIPFSEDVCLALFVLVFVVVSGALYFRSPAKSSIFNIFSQSNHTSSGPYPVKPQAAQDTWKRRFSYTSLWATSPDTGNRSIVCHTMSCGRLGNALFQYASVLGIARTSNKLAFIRNPEVLQRILKNPPPSVQPAAKHKELAARCNNAERLKEDKVAIYTKRLINLEPGKDYTVDRCLQSWMYFDRMRDEIRKAVAFSDDIVHNATQVMRNLRSRYPSSTLVGIHVRRGDITRPRDVYMGFITATAEYFLRAMSYFRRRLEGSVKFIVIGQNSTWNSVNIASGDKDVVVLEPSSAEVDMQILSMMDHLIMSVGTFSWWSAFKMPGRPMIVYFDRWARKGSILDRMTDSRAFMLPHWIPL